MALTVLSYKIGPLDNNTYVVFDNKSGEAAIIDPSFESRSIWNQRNPAWVFTMVLNTHGHLDHIVENAWFCRRTGALLAIHRDDLPLLQSLPQQAAWFGIETPESVEPARFLQEGDTINLGEEKLTVLHTPGHSPGGICFKAADFIIVGDVLFAGSIGRYDLPGGDEMQLLESIQTRLMTLPDDMVVYSGHGPSTTIGTERRNNPYLGSTE